MSMISSNSWMILRQHWHKEIARVRHSVIMHYAFSRLLQHHMILSSKPMCKPSRQSGMLVKMPLRPSSQRRLCAEVPGRVPMPRNNKLWHLPLQFKLWWKPWVAPLTPRKPLSLQRSQGVVVHQKDPEPQLQRKEHPNTPHGKQHLLNLESWKKWEKGCKHTTGAPIMHLQECGWLTSPLNAKAIILMQNPLRENLQLEEQNRQLLSLT